MTAFILAGGKSSRMGSDKAFLEIKGRTLLERALETVRSLTPEAIIVGERSKFASHGTVVEDVFRDRGPLGGIHAALAASATDLNLVLAVDVPWMETALLKYLVKQARNTDAIVTVPKIDGGWQPLCAVYRRSFAAFAERSLLQGQNKIDALFSTMKVFVVDENDLTRRGFSAALFRNLNTPGDFESAKRQRTSRSQ
ncbi:MAG TPA: molybdenum cofactor guanylyltransferase [Terriglobales bacterium]